MTYEQALRNFQVELLTKALVQANGNACKAALALEIHRNTFERMIEGATMMSLTALRAHLKEEGLIVPPVQKVQKPHPRYRRAA